jgi:UDP-N-acetylglucosamine 2-epimerase
MARSVSARGVDASPSSQWGGDVVVLLGSRREAITLAPLIRVMTTSPRWNVSVVTTGGDATTLTRTLESLDVVATEDLGIEVPDLSVGALIGRAIERVHAVMVRSRPSALIIEGESSAVLGASLAAYHEGVVIAHVCTTAPAPLARSPGSASALALNARLISQIAHLHFVPGAGVSTALLHQGVDPHNVVIVGSPAIDNLRWILRNKPGRSQFTTARRHVLVALRPSEFATAPLEVATRVAARLAVSSDVEIVVPLRHRLVVRSLVEGKLGSLPPVKLTGDLDYRDYVATIDNADVVVTDSPSVQADAQTLRKPCVRASENLFDGSPGAPSGAADLAARVDAVFARVRRLLDDEQYYADAIVPDETSLGGLAANSMELRLRAELAHQRREEGRGVQKLNSGSLANNNGRIT